MLHLICNIIKNFNSYRRETLWQKIVSEYSQFIQEKNFISMVL